MTSAPADPYDLLSAELRTLTHSEGEDIWRNRNRLMGLLLDHQPELRREIRSVVAGVEQGVARALSETEPSLAAIAIDRQSSLMETEIGLRPEVARNVTRAIAHALDLGPLPSVYLSERRPPADPRAAPPPAPSSRPSVPNWPAPPVSHGPAPQMLTTSMPRARRFPWAAVGILGAAVLIALAIILIPMLRGGGGTAGNGDGQRTATQTVVPEPPGGFGGELTDFGVPPQSTLRLRVGDPTPLAIDGARRITTSELNRMIAGGGDFELVDVLGDVHDRTIQAAHYLPAAGQPGTFDDQAQQVTRAALATLTDGDPSRAIVFYCMGVRCWESYNAVLRARALGYTNLFWFRGGLQAWQHAGLPMQALPAPTTG